MTVITKLRPKIYVKMEVQTLVWVCLVLLTFCTIADSQANQCYIREGQCSYNIQLSHGCQDQDKLSNVVPENAEKAYEMSLSVKDTQLKQEQRILELERRLQEALSGSNNQIPGAKGIVINTGGPFKEDGTRIEIGLLNTLYSQFTELRTELNATKIALLRSQAALNQTQRALNITEANLLITTQKLIRADRRIDFLEDENRRLKLRLQEVTFQLFQTKTKLDRTIRKLFRAELDLGVARKENEELRKELIHTRRRAHTLETRLNQTVTQYRILLQEHEELNVTLQETRLKLIECYNSKTTSFCGFEDPGICGFTQERNGTDSLDWWRRSKATPSALTGPSTDQTCNSPKGYYLYIEASARGRGQKARVMSPKYYGYGAQCFEFYFHMYGRNTGTLNVFTRGTDQVEASEPVPVWRAYGNQGDVWTKAKLDIDARSAFFGYQVVFEGILETGYQGDIAIDSIKVHDGLCSVTDSLYKKPRGEDYDEHFEDYP
ncbi:unnamed protein product [Owenia fusiformis]|uniref:Uncharacterized protein n=1 Tax=Owenia fusiformis TaxID=6347 RepID=A0A8J1T9R1_OWEFU|nr:unnamed protein product [Owenia fusiformis]